MRCALLALLVVAGCRHVDERKLAIVNDEIAKIGSAAKTPGPRTAEHRARIDADVAALTSNVAELVK